jgi:histidine kinase
MRTPWAIIRKSLALKLIATAGLSLVLSVAALSYFAIRHQEEILMSYVVNEADRLGTTIKLGTRYAMMVNSRGDLSQIITNIGSQPGIEAVRIVNKQGAIKFSNRPAEVDSVVAQRARCCVHQSTPSAQCGLKAATRISPSFGHARWASSAHLNEPGCFENSISTLRGQGAGRHRRVFLEHRPRDGSLPDPSGLHVGAFGMAWIFVFMGRFVIRPIRKVIRAQLIARGQCSPSTSTSRRVGAQVTHRGRQASREADRENRQRDEYQALFSQVPCIITVQDRNFRLLRYNQEFRDTFRPRPGDTCFHAYKGRADKCPNCPVENTFETGRSFPSEESGLDADGVMRHWLVTSSPIKNAEGQVVAAMEMCLDISSRKELEDKLEKSERKHLAIQNITNPCACWTGHLHLDSNESRTVYGSSERDCSA